MIVSAVASLATLFYDSARQVYSHIRGTHAPRETRAATARRVDAYRPAAELLIKCAGRNRYSSARL